MRYCDNFPDYKEVEKMSIGENIKRLRESKNYTQKELAEAVNVTQSMINQIERGTKTLTVPLGCELAKVLDCDLADLTA